MNNYFLYVLPLLAIVVVGTIRLSISMDTQWKWRERKLKARGIESKRTVEWERRTQNISLLMVTVGLVVLIGLAIVGYMKAQFAATGF